MKFLQLNEFGTPHQVVSVEEEAAPGAPAAQEVQVKMLACPINPAEMLLMSGRYASKPDVPYRLGIEGAGEVVAVGDGVSHLKPGDRVMSLGRQNWAELINFSVNHVVKVPDNADPLQLGMLKVNPATAWLMLTGYVQLQPENWLIQNAANSGVGHAIIQLARAEGWKTVNVVRRPWLIDPLKEQGADVVIIDGDDLAERVAEETGNADIKLAIDAVAGASTRRLAESCGDGAVVVNYGFLSGNPCEMTPEQTVFRDMSLRGFWLSKFMGSMERSEIDKLYATVGGRVADGTVHAPVEATYTLDQAVEALEHAAREGRKGKILFTPNGPVT